MSNNTITDDDVISVSCSLCKSNDTTTLFDGVDERFEVDDRLYSVVRCNNCGLVRLNPRPSNSILPQYYPDNFYNYRFSSGVGALKQFIRSYRAKGNVREKLNIVNKFSNTPGLLLDVGCAAGEFLVEARNNGWDVCGIEYSPETATRASNELNMDIRIGSVLDVDLPTNVKVCTFWASMEHIGDPKLAMEKISDVLSDDGIIIILVPNYNSWESRISGKNWPHLDIPRHLYHFEPETLARLGREAGLNVLSVSTPNTKLAVSHWGSTLLPQRISRMRLVRYVFAPVTWLLTHLAAIAGTNHTLIGVFGKNKS